MEINQSLQEIKKLQQSLHEIKRSPQEEITHTQQSLHKELKVRDRTFMKSNHLNRFYMMIMILHDDNDNKK